MKDVKEIVSRAIVLLCLSDRCALEKAVVSGKKYSKPIRENQRLAIYKWLICNNYIDSMNAIEKQFFEKEVGDATDSEIVFFQNQYEGIEPCLWTVGLVKELSSYDNFVFEDFHPVLEIGLNHKSFTVIDKCKIKNTSEVQLQNEISMLWHWRIIEYKNPLLSSKSTRDIITALFGTPYGTILDKIKQFDSGQGDFIVNKKTISEINVDELARLNMIAQWRHHAFEWIIGNEEWDQVEVNT